MNISAQMLRRAAHLMAKPWPQKNPVLFLSRRALRNLGFTPAQIQAGRLDRTIVHPAKLPAR